MNEKEMKRFLLETLAECPEAVVTAFAAMDMLPDTLPLGLCMKTLLFARERLKTMNDPEQKKNLEHAEKVLMARISEKEAEA